MGLKETREKAWSKREAELYVGFLGQLFLNMLKCIIIPLVIPSLITAIGTVATNGAMAMALTIFKAP